MCHWLGTTGLKFIASRLYSVTYTCRLTCLCFFLSVFFLIQGSKNLSWQQVRIESVVIMGVPFFPVENVIVWHGQNVDQYCTCDVLSACGKCSTVFTLDCHSRPLWEMEYLLY